MHNSGNNLHQVAQNRKVGKTTNIKVFGSTKTKGSKQDKLAMVTYAWGRSTLVLINNYIIYQLSIHKKTFCSNFAKAKKKNVCLRSPDLP
jgi:hypothetical protein